MKEIVTFLTLCASFVSIQGYVYVLEQEFFKDNEKILKDLRNISRLDDQSIFTATVNDYGNRLLENFDKLVKKNNMDPLGIGDLKQGFPFGYLKLTEVALDGISSVYRAGNTVMTYRKDSEQLTLEIPLGLENVEFNCNYKAVLFLLGPSGTVTGGVKSIEMMTSIMIDFNVYRAIVSDYDITSAGHISVKIEGNFLFDWAVNLLLNAATTMFKGIIVNSLELVIEGSMQKAVEEIDDVLKFLR